MENLFSDDKTDSSSEVSKLLLPIAKTIADLENDLRDFESEKEENGTEHAKIEEKIAQLNIQLHSIDNELTLLNNRIKAIKEKCDKLTDIYNGLMKTDDLMIGQDALMSIKIIVKSLGVNLGDDSMNSNPNIVDNTYNISEANDQDGSKGGTRK